ncbi:MaoC/PaaZ C-terminal domain-containing protein [Rhodococcus sp. ARC_M6]|uniref:MaoC/PaaZ C-terminal domain-containing protein n=1 Tax=Rhodococcus sp. ARC_M6 TaxID=2928852 RepID=UPI001FB34CDA|nr:MaoC/PaaZ C-terminal domain-containing protein [Rhodococcus sp. ARC_M6]MCJ0907276.1 MaoC family dehydratase N-terminal domain-containing protein [Rhodococcus sp. ARC_M6]
MTRAEGFDVYAEDLSVGDRYEFGHHRVAEAELVDFASMWDPQPFHTDVEAAADHGFGGLIASGLHTLAIYQRLLVRRIDGRWKVIAGRKITEVVFVSPVRPGDVLSGSLAVTEVSLDDRGRGRITSDAEVVNDAGVVVLTVTAVMFLRRRGG